MQLAESFTIVSGWQENNSQVSIISLLLLEKALGEHENKQSGVLRTLLPALGKLLACHTTRSFNRGNKEKLKFGRN